MNFIKEANITFGQVYTDIARWFFVILAIYILIRSFLSLLRLKTSPEVWAYMKIKTYRVDENGIFQIESENSVPITHWENVIGRAESCDIQVDDEALSRNHGILKRDTKGRWGYTDLGSKNGTYLGDEEDLENDVEFIKISQEGEMGPNIRLEYGDTLRAGLTEFTLMPISVEEKANNLAMRENETKVMSPTPSLVAISIFQVLTIVELWITLGTENLFKVAIPILGLMAIMWVYVKVLQKGGKIGFEIETIAFFLSTLSLAIVASSMVNQVFKQFIAIAIGVFAMFMMCVVLRNLERTKVLRWVLLVGAITLFVVNLVCGFVGYGARNWLQIGPFSFQPSELIKVAFIWIGSATLDELFQKNNLIVFMVFSVFCFGCLGLMGDFGTAMIFFVTFVIISFLRSGDFSKLFIIMGVALVGGFMVLQFKPYVMQRFASWGHVWDADMINAAGFQQTRTMSACASGGLFGVGAGNGWLEGLPAANTDMVFGMLIEEWGLIIAVLAVMAIIMLAIFSIRSIIFARSTYYTIAACSAMSMFVFQTILNVFGSVDILPFTGVTFPFISHGGTSMMVSWMLLSFLKSADTREGASLAVKGGSKL